MLAIALKNAILVTLIILIIHFIVKNMIFERYGKPVKHEEFKSENVKSPSPPELLR